MNLTVNDGSILSTSTTFSTKNIALAPGTYNIPVLNVTNSAILECQGDNNTINAESGGTSENPHGSGVIINSVNITVDSGAKISADAMGFPANGPGVGSTTGCRAGGGGYGGRGGDSSYLTDQGGSTYGSITEPSALGSAGGCPEAGHSNGGDKGGGAIKLNATTITINGNISANSDSVSNILEGGGGSGGSIWIIAENLTVSGSISANGIEGESFGGGGGGGRIAIYSNTINIMGSIGNIGGAVGPSGGTAGSAGSIFINATNSITSTGNVTATGYNGTNTTLNFTSNSFTLRGIYNVSSQVSPDGNITLEKKDGEYCLDIDTGGAVFDPGYSLAGSGCSICDEGDELTTCNITAAHNLGDGTLFSANNLIIKNGGSLMNATTNCSGTNHGCGFIIDLDGNLTILSGGNITAGNVTIIAENVIVNSSAEIYVDGLGWLRNYGPGCPLESGYHGASHGGDGASSLKDWQNSSYGSYTEPVSFGSGGNYSNTDNGRDGGGVIKINATGTVTINGTVTADGQGSGYANGAGGSIWIIANSLAGSGSITSDGGQGSRGGGAGGGRVSISYTSSTYTGNFSVAGGGPGSSNANVGEPGTLNLPWNLVNNFTVNYGIALAPGNYTFDNLTVTGATLFCQGDYDGDPVNGRGVEINANTITVDSGATISAFQEGFPKGSGPGVGDAAFYDGGSHGGYGADTANGPYGSLTSPTSLGSGGSYGNGRGRSGGGAIKLNVSGTITVDGNITVNGRADYGNGAGGSVWIIADTIAGSGLITANGGSGGRSGGGGGGRISLMYTTDSFSGNVTGIGGGPGSNNPTPGENGTIFLCSSPYPRACDESYDGIRLSTNFSVDYTVNITRTILNFSTRLISWNDSSTNTSNIAVYNITGLTSSTNYTVKNNSVELSDSPLQTDADGNLPLFNVTLSVERNITVEMTEPTLNISDLSDTQTVYANYSIFYANYSYVRSPYSGDNVWCEFRHNKTGSWTTAINMSFNSSSGQYEIIADGGYIRNASETHIDGMPFGLYYYNISCFNNNGRYNLSLVDQVNISNYSTSLNLTADTDKTVGEQVTFYANYSRTDDFNVPGWLWGREIGQVVWNTSDWGDGQSIALFDYDNDGKKDEIIFGEYNDPEAFYSNGTQIWSMTGAGLADYYVYEIEVADLDNDGFQDDFIIAESEGVLHVFNESGDAMWTSSDLGGIYAVAIGDVTNDSIPEIIAVSDTPDLVYVFNGSGTSWSQLWNASIDTSGSIYAEVDIGDINGDGINDVVAVEDRLFVYNGSNGAQLWNVTGGVTFTITDLDGDAKEDEIVTVVSYGVLGAYNETNGSEWTAAVISDGAFEISALDLDNDGIKEIIATENLGKVSALNATDGSVIWEFAPGDPSPHYGTSLSIGDINNDGNEEIVVGTRGGKIYVFNRSTTLTLLWKYEIGLGNIGRLEASSAGTDISDINNDGINDIAVESSGGYAHILQDVSCTIKVNNGTSWLGPYNMTWNNTLHKWTYNQSFQAGGTKDYNVTCTKNGYQSQTMNSSVHVRPVTQLNLTADTDKNTGEQVTFYANYSVANSSALYPQGLGWDIGQVIWNSSKLSSTAFPAVAGFVDCSNTGKKDCVAIAGHQGDSGLNVLYPNGTKAWNNAAPSGIPKSIEVADLDNDSYYNEVVIGCDDYVTVFNESGDTVWQATAAPGSNRYVTDMVIGDFDNGGLDNDIAAFGSNGTSSDYFIFVYNTSDGSNWTQLWNYSFGTSFGTYALGVGDLDGDGDDDIAAILSASDKPIVFTFMGHNGSIIWNTSDLGSYGYSIAVGDIDGNTTVKDVIAGVQGAVYAFTFNGSVGAEYSTGDAISSTQDPVFLLHKIVANLDLDGDGNATEYVVGDSGATGVGPGVIRAFDNNSDSLWNYSLPISTPADRDYITNIVVEDIKAVSQKVVYI